MKKRLTIIAMLALLGACGRDGRQEARPEGVADPESMVAFLTEAHLVESYYAIKSGHQLDSVYAMMTATYDTLFLRHGLTRAQFDSSLAYYNRHLDEMQAIYEQVENNIRCLDS